MTVNYTIFFHKRIFIGIVIFIALISLFVVSVEGAEGDQNAKIDYSVTPNNNKLIDLNSSTYSQVKQITVKSEDIIDSVYIVFWNKASNYTIYAGETSVNIENSFLHSFTSLPESIKSFKEITIEFDENVNVSDVSVYKDGILPDYVQAWKSPYDKADLLLVSTHADDEHLFFAGLLPYYSKVKQYRVQVAYFTDHKYEPARRHELLNGLWKAGVDHYPVISNFPDAYSTTISGALNNLQKAGYTEEDALKYQTELIRRFKPLVVVGHDFQGEYSHGQHILNAKTLAEAIGSAGKGDYFPDSANQYGIWDTPKAYFHLYKEKPIIMNWDEKQDCFDGLSAFKISQNAFLCHKSQLYTWFYDWLWGNNKNLQNASQINTYSPCRFGLYRTTVGEDVNKNDMFENVINYDEQERLEKERLEQELKEKLEKEAEESRRVEESIKAEFEESRRVEESVKAELEESKRLEELKHLEEQEKKEEKNLCLVIIATVVLISAVIILIVILMKKRQKSNNIQ